MSKERTLSIIKPDGVKANVIGDILKRFESAGLVVVATKMTSLTIKEAEAFYEVHKERPFYGSLTEFMSSGPILATVLEGDDAIKRNRELMGATNPAEADMGTIRRDHASGIEQNAVHGSDAPETAAIEIGFFFSESEMVRVKRS